MRFFPNKKDIRLDVKHRVFMSVTYIHVGRFKELLEFKSTAKV